MTAGTETVGRYDVELHQATAPEGRSCSGCRMALVAGDVVCPLGPGTRRESRYCLTVAEARGYVMLGGQVAGHHGVPGAHCCD